MNDEAKKRIARKGKQKAGNVWENSVSLRVFLQCKEL